MGTRTLLAVLALAVAGCATTFYGSPEIKGGRPQCCLCRARHNPLHAASRDMPRARALLAVATPFKMIYAA